MPRVIYLGLEAFADEPQQLLPTAESPLALATLSSAENEMPLSHDGPLLLQCLTQADQRLLSDWLKQDSKRELTIAWPQPEAWIAAKLASGEPASKALNNWLDQAKYLLKLFRGARRQLTLAGYRPGAELKEVATPLASSESPCEAIYQLAADHLCLQSPQLQEAHAYLVASSQECTNYTAKPEATIATALKQYGEQQQAQKKAKALEQKHTEIEEENMLLLQQLHLVQEAYESLHHQMKDESQQLTKAAERQQKLEKERNTLKAGLDATQKNLDSIVAKLEQRVADLHKAQEQLEKSSLDQVSLRQQLENRQKELNTLRTSSQQHIHHLERLVQWLRVHAQRHAAAVYREIRSYKKTLPKQVAMLEASQFFDADWYREQYPDVAKAGLKPAEHFIKFGAIDGRDPSALFSTAFYLTHYEDVAASGQHPLLHYIRHGVTEKREIRPEQHHLPAPQTSAEGGK